MAKSKEVKSEEKVYSFTLNEYNTWKNAGTHTGIVKDFTTWLDENQKTA